MPFTTGMSALQSAIKVGQEKAEQRKAASGGGTLNYFGWKPSEKKIVRFLTDDLLVDDFLLNIICKDGKPRTFLVDPADPDRLSRYMSPTPGIGWKKEYGGEIVQPYTSRQAVNIAVKREEKLVDGKMVVSDFISEKEIDGQKLPARFFGIVQQAIGNFWEPLHNGIFERYQSTCDRDIEVSRSAGTKNTTYSFIPLHPIPELDSAEKVAAAYFYGHEWNKDDPDRFLKCPMTVTQWAAYFSGEERYAHWLTPDSGTTTITSASPTGVATAGGGLGEFAQGTTSNPGGDEAQASVPANSQFASLRASLIEDAKKAQS